MSTPRVYNKAVAANIDKGIQKIKLGKGTIAEKIHLLIEFFEKEAFSEPLEFRYTKRVEKYTDGVYAYLDMVWWSPAGTRYDKEIFICDGEYIPQNKHGKAVAETGFRPGDKILTLEEVKALPAYKQFIDTGWVLASTPKQIKNMTLSFGWPLDFLMIPEDNSDSPSLDDFYNERISLFGESGYIRTVTYRHSWRGGSAQWGTCPNGSFDPRTEEGWNNAFNHITRICSKKLTSWEKNKHFKVWKSKEDRHAHRGLILSKKYGF